MAGYSIKFEESANTAEVGFEAEGITDAMHRAKLISHRRKVSLWSDGRRVCNMDPPRSPDGNWLIGAVICGWPLRCKG